MEPAQRDGGLDCSDRSTVRREDRRAERNHRPARLLAEREPGGADALTALGERRDDVRLTRSVVAERALVLGAVRDEVTGRVDYGDSAEVRIRRTDSFESGVECLAAASFDLGD